MPWTPWIWAAKCRHFTRCAPVAALMAAAVPHLAAADPPRPAIVLDGDFDDWSGVPAAVIDPADAPEGEVDLREVRIAHDERFVYMLLDFGRAVNVQGLDRPVHLLLDADGDPFTGEARFDTAGVDVEIVLSPRHGHGSGPGRGAAVRIPGAPAEPGPSAYDLQWISAPTFASRRFECRLARGARLPGGTTVLRGASFAGRLVALGPGDAPADMTGTFRHVLSPTPGAAPPPERLDDPLGRAAGTDLRVVSWNVHYGALLRDGGRHAAILRALDPDVLALQELTDDDPERLRAWLQVALGPPGEATWSVVQGRSGGRLDCAVASRLPLDPVPALGRLPAPANGPRFVRAAAGLVRHAAGPVLVVSAHLPCCGRDGSPEDEQRVYEAAALRTAIDALAPAPLGPVVVAGDLNLVGSRGPLERLLAARSGGPPDLAAAAALQLDGRSNATWADPHQPFGPGRLDFVLHGRAGLEPGRAFVLDTADLDPRWLARHGLEGGDTAAASDHLPVVADFRIVPTAVSGP